ncbi:GerAB/ArcD/ProY family transporter [Bacillus taeanensis]|uniref:Spore gernimation protein n=1 Tax=Bacillus taeanensis TaxID=273032 RepID=A0A366Y0J1_9BACI|nr:GerAB/ArcD/ProY family transporter [Bacillus taeanensis]RBW69681.1 spore gernimation protein [Bacillus taeanensis]
MRRISRFQLFTLMMLFEIGSTTLFALGIEANQDAWIATLIGMLCSFVLIWVYTKIQKYNPNHNLADILSAVLGKWIGGPLVFLYALKFFWVGLLNFSEFGELISITLLPVTPMIIILSIFMLTVIYVLCSGYEVLARLGELMLPIVLFFLISTYVLIALSGKVDLTRLQPVLGNGILPVLDASFPALVNFPFGEAVVFLMYWQYVHAEEQIFRIASLAIGVSGLLVTCSVIIIISVLGVQYAANSEIPLFEVIKYINLADIITNLDSISAVILFIGGFFKTTLHFYGGVLAIKSLFHLKNEKWLIFVSAICFTWFSLTYYKNLAFHRWVGFELSNAYIYSFFTFFNIMCPILILIIIWLKSKRLKLKRP